MIYLLANALPSPEILRFVMIFVIPGNHSPDTGSFQGFPKKCMYPVSPVGTADRRGAVLLLHTAEVLSRRRRLKTRASAYKLFFLQLPRETARSYGKMNREVEEVE
jgi:hypothetical protein